MLSDDERRRFEQIAEGLGEDDKLARLDKKARRKAKKAKKAKSERAGKPKRRRRSLTEWAEQRFYERRRRNEGW